MVQSPDTIAPVTESVYLNDIGAWPPKWVITSIRWKSAIDSLPWFATATVTKQAEVTDISVMPSKVLLLANSRLEDSFIALETTTFPKRVAWYIISTPVKKTPITRRAAKLIPKSPHGQHEGSSDSGGSGGLNSNRCSPVTPLGVVTARS